METDDPQQPSESWPGNESGRPKDVGSPARRRGTEAPAEPFGAASGDFAIRRVAILGGGTMGQGIAIAFAVAGLDVTLTDADEAHTAAAGEALAARIRAQIDAGLRSRAALDAVTGVRTAPTPPKAVLGADLVIEAVPEELLRKHDILTAVEPATRPDTIIATNTSSFPIDDLATALARPSRFLGLHWFNPAEWVPGVEVIRGRATDPAVADACVRVLRAAGKRPAIAASSPGFIANRLQMALFAEAVRCVEEGLATPAAVDEIARSTFGFRLPHFGPFTIADMAGLDVYAAVYETLRAGLGERFTPPAALTDLVAQGKYGTKTGAGFATYDGDAAARLHRERDRRYAATARFLADLEE